MRRNRHHRLYSIHGSLVISSLATDLMPLYYFHVRTERGLVEDEEGIDLPHMQAVRHEALVSAHLARTSIQTTVPYWLITRTRAALFAGARAYSITASARARKVGETDRFNALAVLVLMTNSNSVACSTGKSPGFAPFRICAT